MIAHRRGQGDRERGAAAVEFALVLPLLVLLVFGIAEFGRAYHTQVTLTHAAREGARAMALTGDATCNTGPPVGARRVTVNAAPSLPGFACTDVGVTPASCTAGAPVTVVATRQFTLNIPLFPGNATFPLRGTGVMRCGG